ncbi:MAG: alginate O-acetyltransferase AlgF [Trueperaceae bacterium]|nr:alginate O-acetyltransferase AlgF [Trueperaceae bacterium]
MLWTASFESPPARPGALRARASRARPAAGLGALAACALALILASAAAQPGLYGPEAPQDAAWVRVLNAVASGGVAVRVADHTTVVLPLGGATRYARVPAGRVRVDVGGEELQLEVHQESFTTVAATVDGPVAIADPALRDVSRGLLGLMNLTGLEALDLRAPDGTPVVAGVPRLTHQALAVARATTGLVVTAGGDTVVTLEPQAFERGVAYAVAVFDLGDGPVAALLATAAE